MLSAAVFDVVHTGDVDSRYARATRRYGQRSQGWRLASTLFAQVHAQIESGNGAKAARMTADALAENTCDDLHGPRSRKSNDDLPDLASAQAITVPSPEPSPSAPAPAPAPAPPDVDRDCLTLESAATPFSGNWLTVEVRGQFAKAALKVQDRLNWLGYGCIPEDGDYGPVTEEAVITFQRDFGLVVDGKVGPQTWDALFFSD